MKGTILSVIFTVIAFWALNHKTLAPFFKIKRQRLIKNKNFSESNVKIGNVSKVTDLKRKRYRKQTLQ